MAHVLKVTHQPTAIPPKRFRPSQGWENETAPFSHTLHAGTQLFQEVGDDPSTRPVGPRIAVAAARRCFF